MEEDHLKQARARKAKRPVIAGKATMDDDELDAILTPGTHQAAEENAEQE